MNNATPALRQVLLITLAGVLAAAPMLAQPGDGGGVLGTLRQALVWVQGLGPLAPIAFIALYTAATVAFVPGSVLTLGAGLVFGVVAGFAYVFVGACLGATAAFLVGRYLARDWVARKLHHYPRFQAVDRAVGREGLKIVLLMRLSPAFPFNLLNYALGLTGVSLRHYLLGFAGMIPGTLMYVYIGSLAGSIALLGTQHPPGNPALQWTLRVVGFVATVAVTLYVTRLARRALREELGEEPAQELNR